MNEPTRHDIIKIFRERQDKFVYYLMGLNVAAIGFTLSKTYDIKLFHWNHVMLLIAILSWLSSILYAFRWIQIQFKGMQFDMHQYDINSGEFDVWFEEEDGQPLEGIREELLMRLQNEMIKKSERAEKDYQFMLILFITGIIFFMIWRVMEILDILK